MPVETLGLNTAKVELKRNRLGFPCAGFETQHHIGAMEATCRVGQTNPTDGQRGPTCPVTSDEDLEGSPQQQDPISARMQTPTSLQTQM